MNWRLLALFVAIVLMGIVTLGAIFQWRTPAWLQPAAFTAFFVAFVVPG